MNKWVTPFPINVKIDFRDCFVDRVLQSRIKAEIRRHWTPLSRKPHKPLLYMDLLIWFTEADCSDWEYRQFMFNMRNMVSRMEIVEFQWWWGWEAYQHHTTYRLPKRR